MVLPSRVSVISPSRALGFENTRSVRNSVPAGTTGAEPWTRRPSTGLPRPGMNGPPGVGAVVGEAAEPPGAPLPPAPLEAGVAAGVGEAPPPSGPIVGRPASSSALLTSLRRSPSGDATASDAAV